MLPRWEGRKAKGERREARGERREARGEPSERDHPYAYAPALLDTQFHAGLLT